MNDNELVVEREMFSLYGGKYLLYSNCTDNYDVAKIRMKSITDHQ